MCSRCDTLQRRLRETQDELDAWRAQATAKPSGDTERVGRWADRLDISVRHARALIALCAKPGRTFTRADLFPILLVDGNDSEAEDRAVDTHIKRIRRGLEAALGPTKWVRTIYGLGYLIQPEQAARIRLAAGEAA